MKALLIKFLKIYLVFMVSALIVNLSVELLNPGGENKNYWQIIGVYMLVNLVGAIILLWKNYRARTMGIFSLTSGLIFEIFILKTDILEKIVALDIKPQTVIPLIIISAYWFALWGIPSYIFHKSFSKSETSLVRQ